MLMRMNESYGLKVMISSVSFVVLVAKCTRIKILSMPRQRESSMASTSTFVLMTS